MHVGIRIAAVVGGLGAAVYMAAIALAWLAGPLNPSHALGPVITVGPIPVQESVPTFAEQAASGPPRSAPSFPPGYQPGTYPWGAAYTYFSVDMAPVEVLIETVLNPKPTPFMTIPRAYIGFPKLPQRPRPLVVPDQLVGGSPVLYIDGPTGEPFSVAAIRLAREQSTYLEDAIRRNKFSRLANWTASLASPTVKEIRPPPAARMVRFSTDSLLTGTSGNMPARNPEFYPAVTADPNIIKISCDGGKWRNRCHYTILEGDHFIHQVDFADFRAHPGGLGQIRQDLSVTLARLRQFRTTVQP